MMKRTTLVVLNASALVMYFGLFVGVPLLCLVALFIGMVATDDRGGPMFIPIVIIGAGMYLVCAAGAGVILAMVSVVLWIRRIRKDGTASTASDA